MSCITRSRKGAVLLQTLVMVAVLAMIAVMVVKWTMGRYVLVNRVQRSTNDTLNAQGVAAKNQMNWDAPPGANETLDNKQVSFTQVAPGKYQVTVAQ